MEYYTVRWLAVKKKLSVTNSHIKIKRLYHKMLVWSERAGLDFVDAWLRFFFFEGGRDVATSISHLYLQWLAHL